MTLRFATQLALAGALVLCAARPAAAVTITLGDQDFTDGDILVGAGAFDGPSAGEPVPFNAFIGSDVAADFDATFTFAFAPDTYLVGNLTFGIFDHDSAAPGDQVFLFEVDGVDLTADLNALFNAPGGGDDLGFLGSEYNVYNVPLTGAALAAVQDGAASFRLVLQGPLPPPLPGLPDQPNNGAGLDFATLNVSAVPEPSTWLLFTLGLAGIALRRRSNS